MKPGLQEGQVAESQFTVTPQMFALFQGQTVHELLSTSALVHQLEWAARKTILPYLEPHEEGIGARVEVHHLTMTPAGAEVTVRARVSNVHGNKVECEVEAFNLRSKIARGKVVQAIVDRAWLARKQAELQLAEDLR
jgi:predicted thioesterase